MFTPTYLYVKRHSVTGLKYFGKTVQDPLKYPGSGRYWTRHIKKHGKEHVETIWYKLFLDESECVTYAENFSSENCIVESEDWANAIPENGLTGAQIGHAPFGIITPELRTFLSAKSTELWATKRDMMVEAQKKAANKPERKLQFSQISKQNWEGNTERKKKQSETAKMVWENHKETILEGFKSPKSNEHKENIAKALRGKSKSESHKEALSKPKTRCCRLSDRKEISVGALSRYLHL